MGYNGKQSTEVDRFYKQTEMSDSCWLWTGYVMNAGYGALATSNGTELVHRFSYRLFVGDIPDKLTIDHLCEVKTCVNPDHLELVTRTENIQRYGLAGVALKESQKTHCKAGHLYKVYGVRYKNGYTDYGTVKYARRCTLCAPKYLRYVKP